MPQLKKQATAASVPGSYLPDILGPSFERRRSVEHVVVRQKRRFASVEPHVIRGMLEKEDEDVDVCYRPRDSRPLPALPNSQHDTSATNVYQTSGAGSTRKKHTEKTAKRNRTGLPLHTVSGLRVRPPVADQLREIPDEYEYPVTALLVEMEDSFGRPLTVDIPDIPTPASTRIARSTSEPAGMVMNEGGLRVNANVDKPLPPTPTFLPMMRQRVGQRSPVPSVASTGSMYSDYVEDGVYLDSEGQEGSEDSRLDLSEYVVVDLMPAETAENHKRTFSLNRHKLHVKKLKELMNVSERADVRILRLPLRKRGGRSQSEDGMRPRAAQYIQRVGTILSTPLNR